uniref:F-box domain-containing protein n=1 Tax=Caenorhabditis tropicalis TaxID=1561998 RepID=A0A1I7TH70_9PELO
MAAFPLLQLPLLAIEHVLSMMNPYEWINLSMVSSRSKRTVKNYSRITKPQVCISLEITHNPHIFMNGENESWSFDWGSDKSKAGYEQSMDVELDLSSYPAQNKLFTDWLRSQQASIDSMEIVNSDGGFEEDLKYIIGNITVVDDLYVGTTDYNAGFQMEIPITTQSVFIRDSGFINFEQLLRLKNRRIFLGQSILTSREINAFLKSWMACESHLDLETFHIHVSDPESVDDIMDLPCEITDDPDIIMEIEETFDLPEVDTWYDIERSDGMVATVGSGILSDTHRFLC